MLLPFNPAYIHTCPAPYSPYVCRSDSQCSMQQARTGNAGRDFRCGEGLQFSSGGREPPTPSRMPDAHPYGLQASQLRHSSVVPHIDWEISLGGQDNTQRSWHGAAPTTGGRGASVQETPGEYAACCCCIAAAIRLTTQLPLRLFLGSCSCTYSLALHAHLHAEACKSTSY